MLDIRDHGGIYSGSINKSETGPEIIHIVDHKSYFSTKSVALNRILRSKDEQDVFVSLSDNAILKYSATDDTFNYLCTLNELASINPYMYRKFIAHHAILESNFLRVTDNIILAKNGYSGLIVYDNDYNTKMTIPVPTALGSTYLCGSMYRHVMSNGTVKVILNFYSSSNYASKVYILDLASFTLTPINAPASNSEYVPIIGTDYVYISTSGDNVAVYRISDGSALITGISVSSGAMPYLYANRDYYVANYYSTGTYYTYWYKWNGATFANDRAFTHCAYRQFAYNGIHHNNSATMLNSQMFFNNIVNNGVLPYVEVNQVADEVYVSKFDRKAGDTIQAGFFALPFSDVYSNLHRRPNDFYTNNVINMKSFPLIFTAKNSSGLLTGLYLYKVKI